MNNATLLKSEKPAGTFVYRMSLAIATVVTLVCSGVCLAADNPADAPGEEVGTAFERAE